MKRTPTTLRSAVSRAWARAERAAPAADRVLSSGFWQARVSSSPPARVVPLRAR